MQYQPKPIDASQVRLNTALTELVELLARNTHEVWAQGRLAEGWKHGEARDDARKQHPDLVPYEDLPESERAYDRNTARAVIQTLLALGWQIREPLEIRKDLRAQPAEDPQTLAERLKAARFSLKALRVAWESRDPAGWLACPELYDLAATAFLQAGDPFVAHDVTVEGQKFFAGRLRLKQLQALALAQTGSPRAAQRILQELASAGHEDAETIGLLARTHKDFWRLATAPARKATELKAAHDHYLDGFRKTKDYYLGINAAALALLMGQREAAMALAAETQAAVLEHIAAHGPSYWSEATLAEAALIGGSVADARQHYRRAVQISPRDLAAIASSRRQARLLLKSLNRQPGALDDCFAVSPVVVFAGHTIDAPSRPRPRFPENLVPRVKEAIRSRLDQLDVRIGYASAACGADLLFLEAMQERGGEFHAVLPIAPKAFKKQCVELNPGADWGRRFDRVIARAASVTYTSRYDCQASEVGLAYMNRVLLGLATLRCRVLDCELHPLVVWDGQPGDAFGGTASCVRSWQAAGHPVDIIGLIPSGGVADIAVVAEKPGPVGNPGEGLRQEIKAILFADMVGYSKLAEREIPVFWECFMRRVACMLESSEHRPEFRNTWGDALYLVFDSVRAAGQCALQIQELIQKTAWREVGLSQDLKARIGLHAGPVFCGEDPLTAQPTCTGSHVSLAARIEPIAEEGQIYASESFAALAAAAGVREFVCDHVGELALAKHYGACRLYLVLPADSDGR